MSVDYEVWARVVGPREHVLALHEEVMAAERERPAEAFRHSQVERDGAVEVSYYGRKSRYRPQAEVVLYYLDETHEHRDVTILLKTCADVQSRWASCIAGGRLLVEGQYGEEGEEIPEGGSVVVRASKIYQEAAARLGFS